MIEVNTDQLSLIIDNILAAEVDLEITEIVQSAEEAETLVTEQFALLIEAIPATKRFIVWSSFSEETRRSTFIDLGRDTRKWLMNSLADEECYELLNQLDVDDILELAEEIPDRFLNYAIKQLDDNQRKLFDQAQQFEHDQLGRWLDYNYVRISEKLKVSSAKKIIKKGLHPYTDEFYVVNRAGQLIGTVSVHQLLHATEAQLLTDLINYEFDSLYAEDDLHNAAESVILSEKMTLPVINECDHFLGRLDVVSAYQIRQEQLEEQATKAGGLNKDEDLFSNVLQSSKNRGIWLGINLLTAFLASWFIGLFEATLQQVVALAVLMPVVASMGGVSGSQTLTVIVRGLALGQITESNRNALLKKELKVGALNGIIWAVIIAFITYYWFDSIGLSLTISIAILLNLIAAACSGVIIPSILDKLNIDPALSGSVILTTVTDIVGFVVFLGLGSLFLL